MYYVITCYAIIDTLLKNCFLAFCSSCESTGFTTEDGSDYPGNDIEKVITDSFEECMTACSNNDQCIVATWNPNQDCWLKHTIGDIDRTYPSYITGRKCDEVTECKRSYKYVGLGRGLKINLSQPLTPGKLGGVKPATAKNLS